MGDACSVKPLDGEKKEKGSEWWKKEIRTRGEGAVIQKEVFSISSFPTSFHFTV